MATRKKAANRNGSRKRRRSKLEDTFMALCEVNEWPTPEREVAFHEKGYIYQKRRMWRFDFAWPDLMLAVEIDGGLWSPRSGHRSPAGLSSDRVKDAVAQLMGWTILHFTEVHWRDGDVEPLMEAAFDYCRKQQTTEATA